MTVPVLIQAVLLVLTVFCVVGWKRVGCCPLQHNIMSPCVAKMSPLSFNECFVLMRILFDTACWLLFESPCCLFLEMASKCLSENLWLSRHNSALSGVRGRPTVWAWRILRCHMCVLVGLVRVLVVPPQTLITPYSNILLFQRTHPPSDMNSPHLPRSNDVLVELYETLKHWIVQRWFVPLFTDISPAELDALWREPPYTLGGANEHFSEKDIMTEGRVCCTEQRNIWIGSKPH